MTQSIQSITIKKTDFEENGLGNRYIYDFGRDVDFTKKFKIGLQQITMYNSSYNISSEIGNNKMQIKWFGTTTEIIITDGYYEASDFNFFLQKQLILLGYYWYETTYNYYPWEFVINATEYTIEIKYYHMPLLSEASGFTKGSDSWDFPTTADNTGNSIQIILNPILSNMFGYSATEFPPSRNDNYYNINDEQFSSTFAPNIQYVNTYVIGCNLVDSVYSSKNSNILTSLPLNVKFGVALNYNPGQIIFTDVKPSRYSRVIVEFFDQNLQPLKFKDKNLLLTLSIIEEK
jgi:hypothetical protein